VISVVLAGRRHRNNALVGLDDEAMCRLLCPLRKWPRKEPATEYAYDLLNDLNPMTRDWRRDG
jgi:hypothetical protein